MNKLFYLLPLMLVACTPEAKSQDTHGTAGPMQPRPSIIKTQPQPVDVIQQRVDLAQKHLNAVDKILGDVNVQAGTSCTVYVELGKLHIICTKTFSAHN